MSMHPLEVAEIAFKHGPQSQPGRLAASHQQLQDRLDNAEAFNAELMEQLANRADPIPRKPAGRVSSSLHV